MPHSQKMNNILEKDGFAYYFPHFLDEVTSNIYFQNILKSTKWLHNEIKIFGKTFKEPRLSCWFAEKNVEYRYSGLDLTPNEFTSPLNEIKKLCEFSCEEKFNSALVNLYRDGKDSMGFHRDNEKSLGDESLIASISLGESRKFQIKHKTDKRLNKSIELSNGSLLIMGGSMQEYWYHGLAKSKKELDPRINITFRNIKS